jgi:hypothetical protein
MTDAASLADQLAAIRARYESLSREALVLAENAPQNDERAAIVLDMARRYIADANYFFEQGDSLRSLAALSYAHGWLDCGARLKFYTVTDERLFTIDNRE